MTDINIKKLILVQSSACIAETITYPIDYIKTLIQINKTNQSFITIFKNSINNNNIFVVYNGLKPALLRHCIYSMLRINIYEQLKQYDTNKSSLINKCIMGGLSGGISQLIASPCDLLKIRYITNLKKNQNQSLYNTTYNIIKTNGILGLWKGAIPNISRAVLVNCGELATYDYSKYLIKKYTNLEDNTPLHILCSGLSGFTAALCCTPADVVKSRLMQNNSKYSGVVNCIKETIKYEGFGALYKGFFQIWLRLAPWQLSFWITYEKLRQFNNIDSF